MRFVLIFMLLGAGCSLAVGQDRHPLAGASHDQAPRTRGRIPISESEVAVLRSLPDWKFTTKAYQEEALRLMLEEVNRVAPQLPLHEQLPITRTNLTGYHVGPPGLVRLGWVSTTNYEYVFDRQFCCLLRRDMLARFYEAKAQYSWPLSRMDTNKAFQVATQLMTAVSMDVAGLNRDCAVEITEPEREGFLRKHFFPHYWVNWRKSGKAVAYIEFIEPTKSILQLDVCDPTYVLRAPLRIPNLAVLLAQTNTSPRP